MSSRQIDQPPAQISLSNREKEYIWRNWFNSIFQILRKGPFGINGYTKSSLPDAAVHGSVSSTNPFTSLIFVYDEAGGATLAFSDGTYWRRVQDRAVVS